jgi:hypothetical protein
MIHPATLIYVAVCCVVGVLGRKHRFGFWGLTFASIVLSPVVGLLIVIGATKRKIRHCPTCHCPR